MNSDFYIIIYLKLVNLLKIKLLFRYAEDDDDDLANMESSHDQIEKEEKRSLKIGIKEDLEDMRMEQEELRRKKLKKMGKM